MHSTKVGLFGRFIIRWRTLGPCHSGSHPLRHSRPRTTCARYDAYYAQLAEWGIAFVKADFLPAELDADNIKAMASAVTKSDKPIVLSIHGVASPAEAAAIGRCAAIAKLGIGSDWGPQCTRDSFFFL